MAEMMFDLVCQGCGRREVRRWARKELVTVTICKFCKRGMSVMGIAFFAPHQLQPRQTAAAA
jgi:hypothetical protein